LLKAQHERICAAGVLAELLSARDCKKVEPGLVLPDDGLAMLVATDAQVDARRTAQYLLQECRRLGHKGRFEVKFGITVEKLLHGCCTAGVRGVQTTGGIVQCKYDYCSVCDAHLVVAHVGGRALLQADP
jgi:glycine/D-amino acid oxidase-like deaminating enzyme